MPSLQTSLPPELANNVIRLYRECLRRAKYIGAKVRMSFALFRWMWLLLHLTVDSNAAEAPLFFNVPKKMQYNTELLVDLVRQQFRRNMHETDPEKIHKLKDDAARGLINHMLYESEKLSGHYGPFVGVDALSIEYVVITDFSTVTVLAFWWYKILWKELDGERGEAHSIWTVGRSKWFEYDKNGRAIWSDKHGGNNGTRTDQIKLDYPTQYLVSISGFCGSITKGGPVIVRSLSLQTNRKKYGPFGIEQGAPLSLPVNNEMLVGFHGWSSEYLDSIGVYVKSQPQTNLLETHRMLPTTHVRVPGINKKVQSLGPWGGDGGTNFDDGIYTGVREVHIMRSGGLVSIRVCYDQNGKVVWGNKHGGSGGLKLDKIVFDYPYEILTLITGLYGSTILRGPTVVKSLTFHTNKRSYGPFGDPQGFSFSTGSLGAIVGFHGRNGYFVHSLGVHVVESKPVYPHSYPDYDMPNHPYADHYDMPKHVPDRKPVLPQPYADHYDMPKHVVWGMPRQPALYDSGQSGPWGGEGGKSWDDGVYIGVKKIILKRGDAICSIQIQYDEHGHSVWSAPHGIANDACTYHIKFDYPYKVLTSISGSYDILVGDMYRRVIRSLTFHTNKAKYGPYGKPIGTHFSSSNKEGKIVGIHGRSGTFLDAIGVHMQHWVSDELSHQPYSPERGGFTKILNKMYK
uniref:Jacalin-type lectin domain-containing protein n=1 Tax=Chenopodium quinoa TaxID=63459 RepID=A0A803MX75_CHEQI